MQFLVIFFLFALAEGNAEECSEEKAAAYIQTLLSSIAGDNTEEVCKELNTSIECLRNTIEECLGKEDEDEVKGVLQEIEKELKDKCKDDKDEELTKCYEENDGYIFDCYLEATTQAVEMMMEQNADLARNILKCSLYDSIASCYVDRTREKCGQKAADLAEEEMIDVPEETLQACEAAGRIELHSVQIVDIRKKKVLKASIERMRNTVEDCLQEKADKIGEGLQEQEKVLKDNCKDDEDEEISKCLRENDEYINDCILQGLTQALEMMMEQYDDLDRNSLKCSLYDSIACCYVDRTREECGQKAADLAEEEMKDVPEEIQEACETAGSIKIHSFHLLDSKKKKLINVLNGIN